MRKPIIVGNWKMNKTPSEALEFMKGIEEVLTGEEAADYGVGAPYVDLDVCVKNARNLIIAAENCNEKDSGYYIDQLEQLDSPYFIVITSGSKTKAGAEISIVDLGMDGTTLQILVKEKDASKGDFVSPYSPCCVLEVNEWPSDIQIHNINGKVFNPIEG